MKQEENASKLAEETNYLKQLSNGYQKDLYTLTKEVQKLSIENQQIKSQFKGLLEENGNITK